MIVEAKFISLKKKRNVNKLPQNETTEINFKKKNF